LVDGGFCVLPKVVGVAKVRRGSYLQHVGSRVVCW
jgi:hypothetical protein